MEREKGETRMRWRVERDEVERRREKHRGRGISRERERKMEWNIKISGHVFVISGPISCMVTYACSRAHLPAGIFTHTQSVHPLLSRFLHKQKLFIVLPCALSPNHFLTSFL